MCRWLAYSGSPLHLDDLLYKPLYSLVDQSLHSRLGVERRTGMGLASAGTGPKRLRPFSAASSPLGTIGTCASLPTMSVLL